MANWSTQAATRECQIASNGELTVVERLASLLETGQFADVTIRVGEGDDTVTFKAHRLLLATASKSLNNLVTSHLKNGPSGDIATLHVTDIDPYAFQHVLRYLYTDDLKISNVSESLALLKMGKKWELPNLIERTIKYLESFLNEYEPITEDSKNDLCDLTVLTELYGLNFNKTCWDVLVKNVNEVVPCQGFLNMTKDMIRKLLNHPDFNFKDQLVLFESIRDWGMNQVLQQKLSVNSLQGLIGEFLQHVDFKSIKDVDFLDTILPSDCLGKGELIAFFMTRGLEIPRDLAYNNNLQDTKMPYEKTGRYKRGFKLSNQEIYKEHELRFRVDKKLKLLGVGFGFLFSNTDMGITAHCQGPWETRQWRDIIQTYCRVTWEKMKTADVRLMFSEPVLIEPNHSYKILVRVSRMSAGSHDVDLWGGANGFSRVNMQGAEFSFLKAAIDPKKEVEDADTENKPGMITDLFYELDDGTTNVNKIQSFANYDAINCISPLKKKHFEETSISHDHVNEVSEPCESSSRIQENIEDPLHIGSSYPYSKNVPSSTIETEDSSPTQPTPRNKKSYVDEASSYYLATRPSNIRGSDTLPFLKSRQPSVERSRPAWQIPYRSRNISSAYSTQKSREPSVNRESSASRDTNYSTRRTSKLSSSTYDNSPLSKYSNYGVSSIKSKFDSTQNTTPSTSRTEYSTTSPYSKWSSSTSRYGTSTSTSVPESRYGNTSRQLRYTSNNSDTKFGTTDSSTYSRYGSGSSASRYTRESAPSPSRLSTASSSITRPGQSASDTKEKEGLNRSAKASSPLRSSRYSSSSTLGSLRTSSRYGTGTLGATGSSSIYGSSSAGSTGASSTRSAAHNESSTSSTPSSSLGSSYSSRFGTSRSTTDTSTSLGSRYGTTSTSTPSYLSSNRFGTNTSVGFSSRFGSSLYRR